MTMCARVDLYVRSNMDLKRSNNIKSDGSVRTRVSGSRCSSVAVKAGESTRCPVAAAMAPIAADAVEELAVDVERKLAVENDAEEEGNVGRGLFMPAPTPTES